eukprot:SM000289S10404  [mRNA]  locus=s289:51290:52455:+ [translate_table: standard]
MAALVTAMTAVASRQVFEAAGVGVNGVAGRGAEARAAEHTRVWCSVTAHGAVEAARACCGWRPDGGSEVEGLGGHCPDLLKELGERARSPAPAAGVQAGSGSGGAVPPVVVAVLRSVGGAAVGLQCVQARRSGLGSRPLRRKLSLNLRP